LPSGLNELPEPLCRFCRRLLKKACNEAVSDWGLPFAAELLEAFEDAAPDAAVDAIEVVPPRSLISWVNAEFKFAKALEERFAGVPAAVDVALTIWLLLKSLISALSSATIPNRP
jgi:hypothetical protein